MQPDLKQLERRYWDAVQNKDVPGAMELSDDTCILVGARGVTAIEREKLGDMLGRATYELEDYAFDDNMFRIQRLTDDVAIVAYQVHEQLIVDGQPMTIDAYDASVWVRRDGTWRCALHTETLPGDPFGRR